MIEKLRKPKGLTMIEMMVTVVIIGVIAGVAAPRAQLAYEKLQFRSANRNIKSTLRTARSMAVAEKTQFGVHFGTAAETYRPILTLFRDSLNQSAYIYDDDDPIIRVDTLPQEIEYVLTDVNNDVITFAPNGAAGFTGGGQIKTHGYFSGTMAEYYHVVLASTGKIRSTSEYSEVVAGD